MFDTDNRGQVGIGTLIVFIAMVLVAAIAAGVLINTAGFLQTQAQATGEESTEQVANNVEVLSSTGNVNGDTDGIDEVTMTVAASAGSGDIDLNESTIQVIGPGGQDTLTPGEDATAGDTFALEGVGNSDDEVLLNRSDRIQVTIDLAGSEAADEGDGLSVGESADVTITLQSGSQHFEEWRVPDSLNAQSEDDDVQL